MTETEAKTKWCPMVREVTHSHDILIIGSGFCKASGCMMWRRHPTTGKEDHGYCGLAGDWI